MVSSYRNPEAPLCFLLEMTWDFLASSEHDLWHALWRFLAECEEASMSVSTSKFEVIVRCQKNIGLLLFGCQRVAVSRPLGVLFSGDGKRINGWLWWRESWAESEKIPIYQSVYVRGALGKIRKDETAKASQSNHWSLWYFYSPISWRVVAHLQSKSCGLLYRENTSDWIPSKLIPPFYTNELVLIGYYLSRTFSSSFYSLRFIGWIHFIIVFVLAH